MNNTTNCPQSEICGGCQKLGTTYESQVNGKIIHLQALYSQHQLPPPTAKLLTAGPSHTRDRLDFSLRTGNFGLFSKDKSQIVDIETCAQLSPELQAWLSEFRKITWPFEKGSFRLRVSPEGRRGLWIDLANIDVKALLDEQSLLAALQKICFVEIGQRRKIPVWNGEQFKLKDPEHRHWFSTWIDEVEVPLFCQVASFTQPGHLANKLIAKTISDWIQLAGNPRVIEFGSGIGNLSFPAAFHAQSLLACEIDSLALEGFQRSLHELPPRLQILKAKIEIFRGDFQKKLAQDFSKFDLILANPPRSGLGGFLKPLQDMPREQRPRYIIYMSCFPETMVSDLKSLYGDGYKERELIILDQFPQTDHYEVLTLLEREEF